jgi:hypothetical protein
VPKETRDVNAGIACHTATVALWLQRSRYRCSPPWLALKALEAAPAPRTTEWKQVDLARRLAWIHPNGP